MLIYNRIFVIRPNRIIALLYIASIRFVRLRIFLANVWRNYSTTTLKPFTACDIHFCAWPN
ncbi:unnamed protein product [Brugia timori]|uniref:Uncharacterized protein n=1 Tax=Brugia timori TaxID=42155 RepID=A0A3P7VSH3_9BILA|nr:unnamed protein product [Brugia timori]